MPFRWAEYYVAAELGVAGAIHLAHAARSKQSEDFVWAQFVACGEWHVGEPA
jgi:hypothetical protein